MLLSTNSSVYQFVTPECFINRMVAVFSVFCSVYCLKLIIKEQICTLKVYPSASYPMCKL